MIIHQLLLRLPPYPFPVYVRLMYLTVSWPTVPSPSINIYTVHPPPLWSSFPSPPLHSHPYHHFPTYSWKHAVTWPYHFNLRSCTFLDMYLCPPNSCTFLLTRTLNFCHTEHRHDLPISPSWLYSARYILIRVTIVCLSANTISILLLRDDPCSIRIVPLKNLLLLFVFQILILLLTPMLATPSDASLNYAMCKNICNKTYFACMRGCRGSKSRECQSRLEKCLAKCDKKFKTAE